MQHSQQQQARPPNTNEYYNAQGGLYTGWVHVICGVLLVILSILAIGFSTTTGRSAAGIWCGITFFVVAGILGIFSSKRNRGVIIAYLIMSLFCAFVAGCCAISYAISAAFEGLNTTNEGKWFYSPYGVRITIDLFLLSVAIAEFVNSIVGGVFCCSGSPCSSPPPQPQMTVGYAKVSGPMMTNVHHGTTTITTTSSYPPPAPLPQPMVQQQYPVYTSPTAPDYNYNAPPPGYNQKY